MARESKKGVLLRMLAILGGLLLSLFINYHSYLTDFNLVPGDRGDTRLLVFTLEHWFGVFTGQEAFYALHMFYPDSLPLAYADGLFLLGLPYSAFRLLGLDYFTSYQLLLAFMTALGYCAWVALLRRALGLEAGAAVLGAILLASLNSLQFQADIGKLTAIHLFPVLIGLLWVFARADGTTGWRATLSLMGFAGGLGLLFFTSYYPAWFFLFTLGLLGLVTFVASMVLEDPRIGLRKVGDLLAARGWQVALALTIFGVSLIPFFATYAPLIQSNSSRSFSLVLEYSPTILDVVNVTDQNYVWSPVLRALGFDFGTREAQMGSPILVLLLGIIFFLVLASRVRASGWRNMATGDRLLLLLSVTAIVLVAVSIKVGGFSLWYPIYRAIPGASALRALGRILMMLDIIVVLVAICGLDELIRSLKARIGAAAPYLTAGTAILGALLVAEQANGISFRLDKAGQIALVHRYKSPAVQCDAFFINNVESDDLPFGYYQLDAMMVSMQLGIPTINGYSGFEPHEAFTLVPKGVEYKSKIMDWLRSHGATEGICELDFQTGAFRPTNVLAEYEEYRRLYLADILNKFSSLHAAATGFLADGNALADLYPQYLQEHGYLDPSLGYQSGARYKWLQDRYWIGERQCNNTGCFGIGVVGSYAEVRDILEAFGARARRVYFPGKEEWHAGDPVHESAPGELLMIFEADDFGP
ncbi:MAG: hypothetical protein V1755_10760 [Chloroflexota bacterium]